MLAAASDTAVGRVVEYKAVLQNHRMFTFGVTPAYTHALELFLEVGEGHSWASQGCEVLARALRRHHQEPGGHHRHGY